MFQATVQPYEPFGWRVCSVGGLFCCQIIQGADVHIDLTSYHLQHPSMMASSSSPSQVSPPSPDPQRTVEARAAFTAHLTSIGNSHLSALETRVLDIHSNSISISKQEDELCKQTKKLGDESKKHQKVADEAGKKLKELGDIQNWAEVLERDLLVIEETLKMGEGEDSGWETDEGEDGVAEVGQGSIEAQGAATAERTRQEETHTQQH